jgi:hypothetical protein
MIKNGRLLKVLGLLMLLAVMLGGGLVMSRGPAEVEAAGASWPVTITDETAITADTTYSAYQWNWDGNDKDTIEVWYDIDHGTTNTVTLYIDVSPDNSMWKTGYSTALSANAADATGYATATIVGRYYRLRADVTNTNSLTLTLKAIYK